MGISRHDTKLPAAAGRAKQPVTPAAASASSTNTAEPATADPATVTATVRTRLIQRVEEASMNAWPAAHHMLLDGWLIRLSSGFTKRANCVVPLYQSTANPDTPSQSALPDDPLEKIRYCENLYAREQLQTVFRLTSHSNSAELDALLANRGYALLDETRVQLLDLQMSLQADPANKPVDQPAAPSTDQPREFHLLPAPEWLQIYGKLANMPIEASELHAAIIRSIRLDCAFAVLTTNGEPVACALGVLEHDLFGLFDVVTADSARGQGHAGALLTNLLQWGNDQGAAHCYLQVIANNSPARALYQRLGFRDLYSYWYRQR